MNMRMNISFDQILNMVRKDERDFILRILEDEKARLVQEQDFAEAVVVRDAIVQVKAQTRTAAQIPNNLEGIPDPSADKVAKMETLLGAIGRMAMRNGNGGPDSADWTTVYNSIKALGVLDN